MLHKTFTLSTVLYVSETWPLSQEDIDVIDSFERKILRKMFGTAQPKGVRRHIKCSALRSPKVCGDT